MDCWFGIGWALLPGKIFLFVCVFDVFQVSCLRLVDILDQREMQVRTQAWFLQGKAFASPYLLGPLKTLRGILVVYAKGSKIGE